MTDGFSIGPRARAVARPDPAARSSVAAGADRARDALAFERLMAEREAALAPLVDKASDQAVRETARERTDMVRDAQAPPGALGGALAASPLGQAGHLAVGGAMKPRPDDGLAGAASAPEPIAVVAGVSPPPAAAPSSRPVRVAEVVESVWTALQERPAADGAVRRWQLEPGGGLPALELELSGEGEWQLQLPFDMADADTLAKLLEQRLRSDDGGENRRVSVGVAAGAAAGVADGVEPKRRS